MKYKLLKFASIYFAVLITNMANASLITGTFSGGDADEGLDFSGDFAYAINILGNGGSVIGDANFTDDKATGVNLNAGGSILNWHQAEYGDSANDDALEYIMESIRWSIKGTDVINIALADLIIGETYSLQLLFAENGYERGFDIAIEEAEVLSDFSPFAIQESVLDNSQGVFVRYGFIAQDNILNIAFGGSAPFSDNNPILNALTLERVEVPEPATFVIFALGILGLASRRFKK